MSDKTAASPAESETFTEGDEVLIKITHCNETELCVVPEDIAVAEGDYVIVPTKYGKDLGRVLGCISTENRKGWSEVKSIVRMASEDDLKRYESNRKREQQAHAICLQKIRKHKLDMKLVSAHYVLDESKILFFFTADSRVDFRALVRDLVSEFRTRIELRQIGVRDESRVVGGIGVCGRQLCCNGLTDKLKPVSIKMAKIQNLSLNSMKISGPCGRLLCCLAYEYDFYCSEKKRLPSEGHRLKYDGETFKILEVNIVSRSLLLSGDDGRLLTVPFANLRYDSSRQRWTLDGSLEAD
jgi:cell fate regulator YaaT (PSP1 superfamily)